MHADLSHGECTIAPRSTPIPSSCAVAEVAVRRFLTTAAVLADDDSFPTSPSTAGVARTPYFRPTLHTRVHRFLTVDQGGDVLGECALELSLSGSLLANSSSTVISPWLRKENEDLEVVADIGALGVEPNLVEDIRRAISGSRQIPPPHVLPNLAPSGLAIMAGRDRRVRPHDVFVQDYSARPLYGEGTRLWELQ